MKQTNLLVLQKGDSSSIITRLQNRHKIHEAATPTCIQIAEFDDITRTKKE